MGEERKRKKSKSSVLFRNCKWFTPKGRCNWETSQIDCLWLFLMQTSEFLWRGKYKMNLFRRNGNWMSQHYKSTCVLRYLYNVLIAYVEASRKWMDEQINSIENPNTTNQLLFMHYLYCRSIDCVAASRKWIDEKEDEIERYQLDKFSSFIHYLCGLLIGYFAVITKSMCEEEDALEIYNFTNWLLSCLVDAVDWLVLQRQIENESMKRKM